ncbi:hypothetical protein [Pseudemcibacter aquimaris]|uniref:hypothetical protein n=1 Tax=Pseudemcibacter aquimaris TaxID=2857064 RepID=UPI0020130222|nr:hypothetical protein [Pseudemcibacter aquimaris]MCC3860244.1 hypothetical protein [Pseudemcibacter aquimaris]WDU57569.1 hypothetical protein KW060_10220 [Pseudemcibacter aquimaris]
MSNIIEDTFEIDEGTNTVKHLLSKQSMRFIGNNEFPKTIIYEDPDFRSTLSLDYFLNGENLHGIEISIKEGTENYALCCRILLLLIDVCPILKKHEHFKFMNAYHIYLIGFWESGIWNADRMVWLTSNFLYQLKGNYDFDGLIPIERDPKDWEFVIPETSVNETRLPVEVLENGVEISHQNKDEFINTISQMPYFIRSDKDAIVFLKNLEFNLLRENLVTQSIYGFYMKDCVFDFKFSTWGGLNIYISKPVFFNNMKKFDRYFRGKFFTPKRKDMKNSVTIMLKPKLAEELALALIDARPKLHSIQMDERPRIYPTKGLSNFEYYKNNFNQKQKNDGQPFGHDLYNFSEWLRLPLGSSAKKI